MPIARAIHAWLSQKVATRSACAAVSIIHADALLAKALSVQRGSLLKLSVQNNWKRMMF